LFVARGAKLFFETRDFREPFIPPSFEVASNQELRLVRAQMEMVVPLELSHIETIA
jgi:hypothetical protein